MSVRNLYLIPTPVSMSLLARCFLLNRSTNFIKEHIFCKTIVSLRRIHEIVLDNSDVYRDSSHSYRFDGPTPDATAQFLWPDRIRNVIAVNEADEQSFFAATFGLDNYIYADTPSTPLGKVAVVLRFTVFNSTTEWRIENRTHVYMQQDNLGLAEDCISSYNPVDITNIQTNFSAVEAQQRIGGASGFWASPVLYKYNSPHHNRIILLNKSGTLLSIGSDFVEESAVCNWTINLRSAERDFVTNGYRLEYMATPTLIGNTLYVVGLHSLFVINAINGELLETIPLITDMLDDDHFIAPLTFDTADEDERRLYLVSKENKMFEIDPLLLARYINIDPPQFNNCWTAPLVDNSGHIYFTGAIDDNYENIDDIEPRYDYLSQYSRPNLNYEMEKIVFENLQTMGYKGTTLTDRYKGIYFFRDSSIDYYVKKYEFNGFAGSLHFDPLQFEDPVILDLQENHYTYFSNHAALLERADLNRSVIATINNFAPQPAYYPAQEAMAPNERIGISYVTTNYMYTVVTHDSFDQECVTQRSWGGITPYLTDMGCLNLLFGDEHGSITSYREFMPVVSSVGPFGEPYHEKESVNPPLGYSKFQKGKDNVVKYEIQPSFTVNANPTDVPTAFIYANAYGKTAIETEATYDEFPPFPVYQGVFHNLLKHPSYTVTLIRGTGSGPWTTSQFENIDIEMGEIFLGDKPILDVFWTEGDTILTANYPLFYNGIRIHPGARLKIGEGVTVYVSDTVEIMDGATLTLGDGSVLRTNRATCNSPINIVHIQVDENGSGTSKFIVNYNIDITDDSRAKFKGPNLSAASFNIKAMIVKSAAIVEFLSLNPYTGSTNVSARIGWLQNRGNVYINDCVLVDIYYTDAPLSILKINNQASYGHLFIRIPQYNGYNHDATVHNQFHIGYDGMANPAHAQLTIDNTTLNFAGNPGSVFNYPVYGTVNVLGSGVCMVSDGATLLFNDNSHVNLNGGDSQYQNGAQLLANQPEEATFGTIKFSENVYITGYKPDPDGLSSTFHGDRIITDAYGKIEGVDTINLRKLSNLHISSTHPNQLRWDGIYIKTMINISTDFMLLNSDIEGINRIEVSKANNPSYQWNNYVNCMYGIYHSIVDDQVPLITISNCGFTKSTYGVFLEDSFQPHTLPNTFKTIVSSCTFGNENDNNQKNTTAIALRRCSQADINGSNFYANVYGIFALESVLRIGGYYNDTNTPTADSPCQFTNQEKAGIMLEHSAHGAECKTLIYGNSFTGTHIINDYPGLGIWAVDSEADIIGNTLTNLIGHGMLMKAYSWLPSPDNFYHGFRLNEFLNNCGAELIGDAASLSATATYQDITPLNNITDNQYLETGHYPMDPLSNISSWDKYVLANLTTGPGIPSADVRGNPIYPLPITAQHRFYPSFRAYIFDPAIINPLSDLIAQGLSEFYQGLFDQSIATMKLAIETYPDSTLTKLALDYLFLATRTSSADWNQLKSYLDMTITDDNLEIYIKKEEIKTKCIIKLEDYATAISRLQLIIDNPETVADSLFALIDQAYCYLSLAQSGTKSLPDISIHTPDFQSYILFMQDLGSTLSASNGQAQVPRALTLDANYPNPFNPSTSIKFSIPTDGMVNVSIYNIKGQKVKELVKDKLLAGNHSIKWNGTDASNRLVGSGLYFIRIEHDGKNKIRKMTLLK